MGTLAGDTKVLRLGDYHRTRDVFFDCNCMVEYFDGKYCFSNYGECVLNHNPDKETLFPCGCIRTALERCRQYPCFRFYPCGNHRDYLTTRHFRDERASCCQDLGYNY